MVPSANAQGIPNRPSGLTAHTTRTSPFDLEIGGNLSALHSDASPGSKRYVSRDDLLKLPQITYLVSDDPNFTGPTEVSGVPLDELTKAFAAEPQSAMVVAVCSDQYRANYPRAYLSAHHPLLVLKINGRDPAGWPKDPETHQQDMGPYLISNPKFTPSFKIFSHADEAQIPWGVVALEFDNEEKVLGAIAPRGPRRDDQLVQDGYRIAQQNCFRCHNLGDEGGTKAGHPWLVLSAWAASSPEYFAAYVRNPQAKNPHSQMPGNPGYDDATIGALIAYFTTFQSTSAPREKP
jgi:mono/diheme cytochrome c family protein